MSQCIAIDIFVVKEWIYASAESNSELCIESGTGQHTGWLEVLKIKRPSQNQLSAIAAKASDS